MPIKFNLKKYSNNNFVETGTYKGDGVKFALDAGFDKVFSIEVKKEFYDQCVERFDKEIAKKIVRIDLGDSSFLFRNMIKGIKEPSTFWLDAHSHFGGVGSKICPLYDELEAIRCTGIKNNTILIDDRRLFLRWGIDEKKIISQLLEINPKYKIFYEDGFVMDDVLVASDRFGSQKIIFKRTLRYFKYVYYRFLGIIGKILKFFSVSLYKKIKPYFPNQ